MSLGNGQRFIYRLVSFHSKRHPPPSHLLSSRNTPRSLLPPTPISTKHLLPHPSTTFINLQHDTLCAHPPRDKSQYRSRCSSSTDFATRGPVHSEFHGVSRGNDDVELSPCDEMEGGMEAGPVRCSPREMRFRMKRVIVVFLQLSYSLGADEKFKKHFI
jgi:hypothetical protein